MAAVVLTRRVRPSARTDTSLGVNIHIASPLRPIACERDADSRAPSARMPSALSAPPTVGSVVQ